LSTVATEIGVHCGDHDRSFSDGGGDSFDGAGADVADSEHGGDGSSKGSRVVTNPFGSSSTPAT
jgi:hypothetical protein